MKKRIQKHMGCMDGFVRVLHLQMLFERKRVCSTKRLSSSPGTNSTLVLEKSEESREVDQKEKCPVRDSTGVDGVKCPSKLRECPRLSLDSQAIVDGKGSLYPRRIRTNAAYDAAEEEKDKQRGSPSLVARLMGLETLPEETRESPKEPKLRRTSSEPKLRDLVGYKNSGSYTCDDAKKISKPEWDRDGAQIAVAKLPPARELVRTGNQSPQSNLRCKTAIPPNTQLLARRRLDQSRNGNKSRMVNSKPANCKGSNAKTSTVRRRSSHPSRSGSQINNKRTTTTTTTTEICLSSSVPRNHKELERKNYKEVKNLLTRCDMLVKSIAGITPMQSPLSPVSVLDMSSHNDDISPQKRCVDWEGRPSKAPQSSLHSDFPYVTKILQAYNSVSEDLDLFSLLEKQCYRSDSSNVSKLHRRLVFDTITEIRDKLKDLEAWRVLSTTHRLSFRQIWLQFLRLQEPPLGGDLFELICSVLGKDLANETFNGWRDCRVEMGDMVLDIEKMIFKDLVGEMIQDLAASKRNHRFVAYKVVF